MPDRQTTLAATETESAAACQEIATLIHATEQAAEEWGIRDNHYEAKFLTAMLSTAKWLGRMTRAATTDLKATIAASKEASQLEISKLKTAIVAANLAVQMAGKAEETSRLQQDVFVRRFVDTVTPDLVRGLSGAIVLREKRLHRIAEMKRIAIIAGMALFVFLGGYIWRATQDETALAAIRRCDAQHRMERTTGEMVCAMSVLHTP